MTLSPLSIAVLGLLRERPMHPYEMHQLLTERRRDLVVKVRTGSLYHTIDRLERDGLLTPAATEREGNRPERTTYRLTTDGDRAIESWVRDQLATVAAEFPAFPFALAEAHNLSAAEVAAALTQRADALSSRIEQVEGALNGLPDTPEVYRLGTDRLLATLRSERDWTRELVAAIERKDFPWQPHA